MDDVFFEIDDSRETVSRPRVRSLGETDRPLSRAASAPMSRPSPNLSTPHRKGEMAGGKATPRGSHSPVPPVRSHSLNQQEAILYRNRAFNRMTSLPVESSQGNFSHSSYRENRRRTPPPMRAARVYRYGDTSPRDTSQPPSPVLSSTSASASWSSYSTPPSSPSSSTQFVSAESSLSHSPQLGGPSLGEETIKSILNEVEAKLSYDRTEHNSSRTHFDLNNFKIPDLQSERWMQWESITQQTSSQKDALEQETLVWETRIFFSE